MKIFVKVVLLQALLVTVTSALCKDDANITVWRQHRRQKRFILFEDAGICKLVCGITYPVDLEDKRPWRQLVMTMNLQYQFPVPPKPIYWWDKFDEDRSSGRANHHRSNGGGLDAISKEDNTDYSQMFIYDFVEELMNQRQINGRACMLLAICENVQIHHHQGIYSRILYRILIPHKSLNIAYRHAHQMGRQGIDCRKTFPKAQNCLLDQFLHVIEEDFHQTFVY